MYVDCHVTKSKVQAGAVTHHRLICGRFDEYYPVIELFLNYFKNSVQGFIIKDSEKGPNVTFVQIDIFEGILSILYIPTLYNISFIC
jgi:hypothetical protein